MSEEPTYAQLVQRIRELENATSCWSGQLPEGGDVSQSEAFCRQLVETLSEQICRFRLDGTLTFANTAFCNCFGVDRETLNGKDLFTLLAAEDHDAVRKHLASFSYRRPIAEQERRAITKEGDIIWLHCSDCALFDDDRQVIGFQSVGRDVTQRKQAEEALCRSEAKHRAILDAMQDAVYICSQDYRIEFMNRALIGLLGRDATGETCHREIFDQDAKCSWCAIDQVIQGGGNEDYELCHPANGRCYSVATTTIEYHRHTVSYLAILRDMTEFKKMQDHLRQTQKMEALARLAGGIAHDFNNILAAISGYTELLVDQIPPGSEAGRNLDQVLLAGQRAKRLVRQIIQFIRPENAAYNRCDPVAVVSDALSFLRSSLPSSIDLHSELEARRTAAIDQEQLFQVVVNLCTNAAHAMEEKGGRIKVSLADVDWGDTAKNDFIGLKPGEYVALKVIDNGHGMDAGTLKMIFDPYFSTKDRSKGSGLGLSIVHGIVEARKGAIKVDSRPGRGAAFQILLPAGGIADEPVLQGEMAFKAAPEIEGTILFIDDEPALAQLGRKRLEKWGCKVVAETDPKVALRRFQERPDAFRLVITDMTMPQMTGDKLAAALIAIRPDIPIIICTGFNHRIDEETSKKLGVRAFLTKPVDKDQLFDVVNRVLGSGHS